MVKKTKWGEIMIGENIKRARLKQGVSQEKLAVRLHVVRQTVSKWEKGRSVPDAEMLIQIADFLDVPVNQLFGVEPKNESIQSLADELDRLNAELAQKNKREDILRQANKKRGTIILMSFSAMIAALIVKNELFSILLMSACMIVSLIILYRNLALMTVISTDDLGLRTLRFTTIFDLTILIIALAIVFLEQSNAVELSSSGEKWIAACVASIVI